ncbi:hypothetical protein F4777DRAFT_538456 [Nemania sp. FL0916]|nr:hypothetical protein F4777DRAFT_538456 [Nemania sp. FL0916]
MDMNSRLWSDSNSRKRKSESDKSPMRKNSRKENHCGSNGTIMKSFGEISSRASEMAPRKMIEVDHDINTCDRQSNQSDAYPLDDGLSDNDIVQFLTDPSCAVLETHIPPTSVLGWDHESRSAAEYDPSLKYSPPEAQEVDIDAPEIGISSLSNQTNGSQDLLDEDVDWDAVLVGTKTAQRCSSTTLYHEIGVSQQPNPDVAAESVPVDYSPRIQELRPSAAFVRAPFPEKIRDRPSVPGMSSDTVLRTCFRIGVMVSQTLHCYNHQQDVIFELYARVTYSSRETSARKQHFQFVDLSKDQQPYPAATLTNWRIGSQLDKDSSIFLDTSSGPRPCRCMCKPVKEPKAAIGWTYTVLTIGEVSWEQIHWAEYLFNGDSQEPAIETAAE